jgi:hypothetical protein
VNDPAPHARVLSNGRYAVLITSAGTGYSTWNGYALTNWTAERSEYGEGFFIYLRNLERNQLWSIGYQPARQPANTHAASIRSVSRWEGKGPVSPAPHLLLQACSENRGGGPPCRGDLAPEARRPAPTAFYLRTKSDASSAR